MSDNKKNEGSPMFSNIWGWKFNKLAFIVILVVFLAMISLKMCDSPYVVQEDPGQIDLFGR